MNMFLSKRVRNRIVLSMVGLMMLLHATTTNATVAFITKPYLQNPATDAMTVMWLVDQNSLSWVEYGESFQLGTKSTQSSDGLIAAGRVNKVRLTELKPGTQYYYKVYSKEIVKFDPYKVTFGNTVSSGISYFITPGTDDKQTSMLILNDLHERPESFSKLIGMSRQDEYDYVFYNGDIFDYLTNETQIATNIINPSTNVFASIKPFLQVRGNHETRGLFARNYLDYFDASGDKPYYTFTRGPVFFIVIDSGEDKEDENAGYYGLVNFDAYRLEQARWLEQVMQSPEYNNSIYKVVLMHIPPLYAGTAHGTTHCKEVFVPIFNQYKVDMVISGHTHSHRVHSPVAGIHDFPLIIGGGPTDGKRTLIKLKANETTLDIQMLNDGGSEVGQYTVNANGPSAVPAVPQYPFNAYVEDETLLIESGIHEEASIYDLTGLQLKNCTIVPGLNKIDGLAPGQVLIVKISDYVQKIVL